MVKPFSPDRKFGNVDEVGAHVGLKGTVLKRLIRLKKIPAAKPGRGYFVRISDVEKFLEGELRMGGRKVHRKSSP